MQRNRPDSPVAGFTLLELVVASLALLLLTLLVTQLIISGQTAHRYATRLGKLTDVTHRVMDEVKTDLRASVRVFGNDGIGNAYRDMLQPWIGFPSIASSRLSTIMPAGSFDKDTPGVERTGNELLFARHAWSDAFTCTSGKSYRVDIYRIEHLFLRQEGSTLGKTTGFNLCRWTGEPLANASQIDRITDPDDRTEFLVHLLTSSPDVGGDQHDSVNIVWRFGEDPTVAGTLRQILVDGSLSNTPQAPRDTTWQLEQAENLSDPGFFYSNLHVVASNSLQQGYRISRFAILDDSAGSGVGYPHGLEFQVIGPASARKILMHLTTMSTNADGLKAQFDMQTILNVREG